MKLIYESELYHHGVKGMKWGVRRDRAISAISKRIEKETKKRKDRFDDNLASRDPINKRRRERIKEREKQQHEINEILQAKGKAKTYKILKKIGSYPANPIVIDAPTGPKRKPWDEKRDPDYRGGRI